MKASTLHFSVFLAGVALAATAAAQQPDTLKHSIPAPISATQVKAELGRSVAVEGNYSVTGAPKDDFGGAFDGAFEVDAGVVKVFHSVTGALLFIIPNPTPASLRFGSTLAISGARLAVGGGANTYVFDLNSATPTVPVATLPNGGQSVAISGTRIVVGTPNDNTGGVSAGRAFVFDLNSATPTVPVATLDNPSPAALDQFGHSVAISGTQVVVGAVSDDTGGFNVGSAYVYNVGSATPNVPIATLNNPSPTFEHGFGSSVACSGTRVVIGRLSTGPGETAKVYVYNMSSATPTVPVNTINSPVGMGSHAFGQSVAISGTRVVVGASGTGAGGEVGNAYVYNLTSATPTVPAVTLNNPTPVSGDRFGFAVAIFGTRVLIGAPEDDTGAEDAGSAYGYDVGSATPTVPVATFNNPGMAFQDNFGNAVALSGTRLVVGAWMDDTGAVRAGRAYVYNLSSATPTVPEFTLDNPGPGQAESFGIAVAIEGTRVVVGARWDGSSSSGRAYLYELSGPTPTAPIATFSNPTLGNGDEFGSAVAISGQWLVIGARLSDNGGTDCGRAYVYNLNSGTPTTPAVTLNNPTPVVSEVFGVSVAVSGLRVAVGARDASYRGSVYIYDLGGATPAIPAITLTNPISAIGYFGDSVALSGNRVAVGAPFDSTGAAQAGRAYVYDLSTATPTVPAATFDNPAPAAGDEFGKSVAISGTRVVVGTYRDDAGATDGGRAYLYDLASGTPTVPVVTLSNPSPASGDRFGFSVAIEGTTAVIGTPFDDGTGTDKGWVYVFGPDSDPPTGGSMSLLPPSPVDGNAALTVSFTGWTDTSMPLSYLVLVDEVNVSPIGSSASRNFTGPFTPGVHILKGRIYDSVGNFAEVTQNFTVNTPQETWRYTYFGTTGNTGNAADTADPDGDGWNNHFEYIAGLIPTDPASRLSLHVDVLPGQPGEIVFSPVVAGRQYVVMAKASLTDPAWTPLANFSISDNGTERTVTDLDPILAAKFYRLEIALP